MCQQFKKIIAQRSDNITLNNFFQSLIGIFFCLVFILVKNNDRIGHYENHF